MACSWNKEHSEPPDQPFSHEADRNEELIPPDTCIYPVIVTGIHNGIGRYIIKPCKSNYSQAVKRRTNKNPSVRSLVWRNTHPNVAKYICQAIVHFLFYLAKHVTVVKYLKCIPHLSMAWMCFSTALVPLEFPPLLGSSWSLDPFCPIPIFLWNKPNIS